MKTILHTASTATLGIIWMLASPATANEEADSDLSESVLEAIREFNERAQRTQNEVLVVLDPPEGEQADDEVITAILGDEPEADDAAPDDNGKAEVTTEDENPPTTEPSAPQGPQVRVQSLRDIDGTEIRVEDIEISTPFAAKPLGSPPAGWKLVSSSDAAEFTENIEVTPGTWLTLSIRPHLLVPDADGHSAFHIAEPGFDPALGYQQRTTISSTIASSLHQLEQDARVLGQAIDDLEQILISLPRPANLHHNNEEIAE